jgi:trans-2,3-dihydro-3-hydroxyanthranilate isomerase
MRRGVDAIELITKQGPVSLTFDAKGRGRMQQPLPTMRSWPGDVDALLAALGGKRSLHPVDLYDNGVPHLYVVFESVDEVAGLRPDFGRLGVLAPHEGVNCVAGKDAVWKSRMFGTGLGMNEDAATGSAAGPLAVHLARHGVVPWGTEITITQGVEIGRPSTLYAVALGGEDGVAAVEVAGDTVVVGRGTFDL